MDAEVIDLELRELQEAKISLAHQRARVDSLTRAREKRFEDYRGQLKQRVGDAFYEYIGQRRAFSEVAGYNVFDDLGVDDARDLVLDILACAKVAGVKL